MSLELDRSDWQCVKFGDVVKNVNESVKDPAALGIERVIGLEHLESGELRIDRWGEVTPETKFTKSVKPGQTLFGKRRSYQRKTAYAEFDAVCSGDILVFESADPMWLLPELLPLIAMTDGFYDKALETSAGSLSPRTRWSDLAKYEFDLPPLDQQRRIADLLWAVEGYLDSKATEAGALADLLAAQREEGVWGSGHEEKALSAVVESCEYGTSERCLADAAEARTPVLRIPNVVTGKITLDNLKYLPRSVPANDSLALSLEDLLVVRTNGNPAYVGVGALVPSLDGVFLYASYLLRIRVNPSLLMPEFLDAGWKAQTMRRRLAPYIKSSAGNYNLSASSLLSRGFPIPSIADQDAICSGLRDTEAALDAAEAEVIQAKMLRETLISKLLGGGR